MNASAFVKVDKQTFYRFVAAQVEGRFEYVRGRIMQQMTGGTRAHQRIAGRFVAAIGEQIDPNAWVVIEGRGVETPETIRYPDVVVEPASEPETSLSTLRPSLVIEVLSPTSIDRDLELKPAEYTGLGTLAAYIVASQDEPACLLWLRDLQSGRFPAEPERIAGLDAVVRVAALKLEIPLRAVYRGIAEQLIGLPGDDTTGVPPRTN